MANIYEQKCEDLHILLERSKSGDGATILIPDLQRPYVWTPNQVTLLVDSIIRGWPFGTLLMWKAGPDELQRIPHRQFWQVVDRTDEGNGTVVARKDPPASFHMVLDGQQRLQSLLLALGGDGWGFKLEDREWKQELQDIRRRGRSPKYAHWSKGSLCFDTDGFLTEYERVGNVQSIDYRNVLKWVITDSVDGQSKWNRGATYEEPLERSAAGQNVGRFVRLSRLWAAVSPNPLIKEKQFRDEAQKLYVENGVPTGKVDKLLAPTGELMSTLRDVKTEKVTFLELREFDRDVWTEDAYNDAIVTIFTRLNTAGRTLTRQEITLAWLKVGWKPELTGDTPAGECFEKLRDELWDRGVKLDIDELVMAASFLWSVVCNQGQLLANKDLLRGATIQPMAEELSKRWKLVRIAMMDGLDRVKERGLKFGPGGQFDSLYSIAVLWAWLYLATEWSASREMKTLDRDAFQKSIWRIFDSVAERWLFGSSWAGRWSSKSGESARKYAKLLNSKVLAIAASKTSIEVLGVLERVAEEIVADTADDATAYINTVSVNARGAVSAFRDLLWIWHRIDAERWKMSQIPLRTSSKSPECEVDHLVAYALYDERAKTAAAGDQSKYDALLTAINSLGNCSLLEKTFNISKSKKQLKDFLDEVDEFKSGKLRIDQWAKSMHISHPLLTPSAFALDEIRAGFESRDSAVRDELVGFVQGKRRRVDVS
ncbi:MAG TPA: DUF262 domain-containing protein [Phycisphaerae bacterium]|nr:DUF262 domain-containing protein [Phycisphaerae bacterium]